MWFARSRSLVGTMLTCALVIPAGAPALAGSLLSVAPVVVPFPSFGGNLKVGIGSAGDVNGDGFEDLIVGDAWGSNGQDKEGIAYLYFGGPLGPDSIPDWVGESNQADAWYGFAVAGVGDVNGDGFDDILVGAFRYTNTMVNQGRAYLYLGSATGPGALPDWTTDGTISGGLYANSVAAAGDVNGDGFADVAINTRYAGVSVFYGSLDGLSGTPNWAKSFPGSGVATVAGAGDVNSDGYDDLLIGEDGAGSNWQGAAHVYFGSAGGLLPSPGWSVAGETEILVLGDGAGGAGDVNGDGYDDVLVSTYQYDGGLVDRGRAWLYLGSPDGPSHDAAWSVVGDADRAWLGWNVAATGDVDGDSYADVLISARNAARVYLYRGSPQGLDTTPAWDAFGLSVGIGGDFNGDGLSDVPVHTGLSASVYVNCRSGPIADAGDDFAAKQRRQVTLDASGTQSGHAPLLYEWDVDGDGIADASGITATWRFTTPGTKIVTLTVTDALQCVDSDTVTILIPGHGRPVAPGNDRFTGATVTPVSP